MPQIIKILTKWQKKSLTAGILKHQVEIVSCLTNIGFSTRII